MVELLVGISSVFCFESVSLIEFSLMQKSGSSLSSFCYFSFSVVGIDSDCKNFFHSISAWIRSLSLLFVLELHSDSWLDIDEQFVFSIGIS